MIGMWFYEHLGWVLFVFTGTILVLATIAALHDCHEYERLMTQCRADGHKEYECASMLRMGRSGSSYVYVAPVIH